MNSSDSAVPCEYTELAVMVKEMSGKDALIGELKLTSYKLVFTPNGYKPSQIGRFAIPYGCILNITENANDNKTHCTLTVKSKDER